MKPKTILWIVLAALIGEIALVLFTTIAQEVLFDGIDYYTSTYAELTMGGIATFIAAMLADCVTSLFIRNKSYWPHLIISLLIVAEMIYLVSTGRITGPHWFSFSSGLSLIVGIWFGYYLMKRSNWKTSTTAS